MNIVAVTACPTGIAHTYMAAERLEKAADTLDLVAMAQALNTLVDTARAGTTAPNDMLGTTITITNVGPF
ncbi:MAG TPA: 2-oxo acid dehydrogenase subunit E2, partial [Thermoanaerobaculaceae bacterium]|nr:2-oxo acid dehydrogenase subunit E2 [Thermoanaerobaculaceae bacterium]